MTDLDALKRVWQEPPVSQEATRINKEQFMAMIQARTADIKQRTMQRVRAESYNYLALAVIPVLMFSVDRGSTLQTALAGLGVLATLGPILGVLAYKEYRLRTMPPAGSLRQSLAALVAAMDSTSRFYFATYMACVVVGVASVVVLLFWRQGVTWIPAGALVAASAFAVWAFRSGRAYARRLFGKDRAELMRCLAEIERV